jgi:alpha-beta hydrolase superfamily lysophospholipase
MTTIDFEIPGAKGLPIVGTTHRPDKTPTAVVLIGHGFKGYKDYGFLPPLAQRLASEGRLVHRFNFSHSGMTHGHGPFDEDLFRKDTWSRQIEDVQLLIGAIQAGDLEGGGLPIILVGHSRGGVTMILAAGRHAEDPAMSHVRGIITLSAPADACGLSDAQRRIFHRDGCLESPSSRTGQKLLIDAAWLREQQADPEGHDLATQAGRLRVPVAVVHGLADQSVSPDDASLIAEAAGERAMMRLIQGADHVFNTPNPADPSRVPSPQLLEMEQVVVDLCRRWVR